MTQQQRRGGQNSSSVCVTAEHSAVAAERQVVAVHLVDEVELRLVVEATHSADAVVAELRRVADAEDARRSLKLDQLDYNTSSHNS